MSLTEETIGDLPVDKKAVGSVLGESLNEKDLFCTRPLKQLLGMGLEYEQAIKILAGFRSKEKYGYGLSLSTLEHLLDLSKGKEELASSLAYIIRSPMLFVKAAWIYEHAPAFIFHQKYQQEDLDSYILSFAWNYRSFFLDRGKPPPVRKKLANARRILMATFWDKDIWDPVEMIALANNKKLEGVEIDIDFHPFNPSRLLPEEITAEKRSHIREFARSSGTKIDIHSPIVGPYSPVPDPKKGRPMFYNPLSCLKVQKENIMLARDIGAGAVVVHLIDISRIKEMADLVMTAAGTSVRVTLENYCETEKRQDAETFISVVDEICNLLPSDVLKFNFGITLDVGHLNIEGIDPLIGAEKIGRWCRDKGVFLRMHATDNYGKLLYYPPHYSADVHGRVSGKGINNSVIIKMLRSMGHEFRVLAEQIQPLSSEDIACIDQAQRCPLKGNYEELIEKGRERLSGITVNGLIGSSTSDERGYQFMAGLEGVDALREYLMFRKIQDKKYLSVDEAKDSSLELQELPGSFKHELIEYIDDLLIPVQSETGLIDRSKKDLISQNISGALFRRLNRESMERIFKGNRALKQGDIVFEQDSIGNEMHCIKQGGVEAIADGVKLAELGPGEIFGEMSLFYNIKRTATIRVNKANTVLGTLDRGEFEDILLENRGYAYELIYRLFYILPQRLRNLNEKYRMAIEALSDFLEGDSEGGRRLEGLVSESSFLKISLPALPNVEIERMFKKRIPFEPGERIFMEGDKGDGVYFMLEGRVKVVIFTKDSREIILGEIETGQVFGEMALIDGKPRSANVVSVSKCKMGFMSREQFDFLIQTKSDLAYSFMSSVCVALYRHLLRLNEVYLKVKREFK